MVMSRGASFMFSNIERRRGIISNRKKFEPIVQDIYDKANSDWHDECTRKKRFGLQFIHKVVTTLNYGEQTKLLKEINDNNIKSIKLIELYYQKILNEK